MNKKKYVISFLVGFIALNMLLAATRGDGTYTLNRNQSLRKDVQGKAGERYTWKIRFEIYGSLQRLILNQSQYENREILIYESECYSKTSIFSKDAGLEKSGSFTVPYDDTWHIYWVNRGLYTTFITLYNWKLEQASETIGIDLIPLLIGFIAIGIMILGWKYRTKYI